MNVTKQKFKGRKLHEEDCLQMVAAERREYVEVPASVRIAENNGIVADLPPDSLLRRIISRNNMNEAYKKVKSNKGAGGVDRMSVDELLPYLSTYRTSLLQQIRDGCYRPNPVRRVEIPKEERGKVRKLGIQTVVDRVVQHCGHGLGKVLRHGLSKQTHRDTLKKY